MKTTDEELEAADMKRGPQPNEDKDDPHYCPECNTRFNSYTGRCPECEFQREP